MHILYKLTGRIIRKSELQKCTFFGNFQSPGERNWEKLKITGQNVYKAYPSSCPKDSPDTAAIARFLTG
jgi:hypothetical protein